MVSSGEFSSDDSLYVRVRCSICLGTKSNYNGRSCPYCDEQTKQYVEASFKHIKEQLTKRSTEDKMDIINTLNVSIGISSTQKENNNKEIK